VKLPSEAHLPSPFIGEVGQKGAKKLEAKKIQKEQARLEKRQAKELQRKEIAERKKLRGMSLRT
jgi:SAGA-associated factor 73